MSAWARRTRAGSRMSHWPRRRMRRRFCSAKAANSSSVSSIPLVATRQSKSASRSRPNSDSALTEGDSFALIDSCAWRMSCHQSGSKRRTPASVSFKLSSDKKRHASSLDSSVRRPSPASSHGTIAQMRRMARWIDDSYGRQARGISRAEAMTLSSMAMNTASSVHASPSSGGSTRRSPTVNGGRSPSQPICSSQSSSVPIHWPLGEAING